MKNSVNLLQNYIVEEGGQISAIIFEQKQQGETFFLFLTESNDLPVFKSQAFKSSDILRRPQKFGSSSTYNLTLLSNVKKEGKLGQIFVAYSE